MSSANFTIYADQIIINNITEIKEFSEKLFILKVEDTAYEITGENLVLKEVTNDNRTLKITGTVNSVAKTHKQPQKSKGFIKRLFS